MNVPQIDVMNTARNLGLIGADGSDVFGTIERDAVLGVLADFARDNIFDADLFAEASTRVIAARSAGVERLDVTSILGRRNSGDATLATIGAAGEIQLSYRAEMAAIFVDLAIDLGLRHSASKTPADIA